MVMFTRRRKRRRALISSLLIAFDRRLIWQKGRKAATQLTFVGCHGTSAEWTLTMLREQKHKPTGRQIAAARTLIRMTQTELAEGSNVSVPTIKRMEASNGPVVGMAKNIYAVCRTLQAAGVIFIYENGYGPGVRTRKTR